MDIVQNIVLGASRNVHVARIESYADANREILNSELLYILELEKPGGIKYVMATIVIVGEDFEQESQWQVQVAWVDMKDVDPTWYLLSVI